MSEHKNDIILIAIQYFSIIVSGGLGFLGLFVDYKDKKTKKLTSWGKTVSAILIISLILGVVSKTIEVNRDNERQATDAQKARKAAEETLKIVQNTERLTNAVRTMNIDLRVGIPFKAKALDGIRSALIKKFPESADDRDLSMKDVKGLASSKGLGDRIAYELFNPQPSIWLFPKNTKVNSCIFEPLSSIFEDRSRTNAINFSLDSYPSYIEIPQFEQGFWLKLIGQATKHGGPQVLSLNDFDDATIIIFFNTLVQQTSNSKTDTRLFVRYEQTVPMQANDCSITFYINQDKSISVNDLKLMHDKCSNYPYFLGHIKLKDQ